MIRHEFREEESSLGKVFRPVADVILERDEFRVEIPMYIDSGADISVIPYVKDFVSLRPNFALQNFFYINIVI